MSDFLAEFLARRAHTHACLVSMLADDAIAREWRDAVDKLAAVSIETVKANAEASGGMPASFYGEPT